MHAATSRGAPQATILCLFFLFFLHCPLLFSYLLFFLSFFLTSHPPHASVRYAGLQVLLLGISAACMFATSVLVGFLDGAPHVKLLPPPLIVDIESAAVESPPGISTPAPAARLSLERRNSSGAVRTLPSPAASAAAAAGIFPSANPPAHAPCMHASPRHLSGGHQSGGAAGGPGGGDGVALRLPPRLLRRRNGAAGPRRVAASMHPVAWIRKCDPNPSAPPHLTNWCSANPSAPPPHQLVQCSVLNVR